MRVVELLFAGTSFDKARRIFEQTTKGSARGDAVRRSDRFLSLLGTSKPKEPKAPRPLARRRVGPEKAAEHAEEVSAKCGYDPGWRRDQLVDVARAHLRVNHGPAPWTDDRCFTVTSTCSDEECMDPSHMQWAELPADHGRRAH